jgi:hypothetical protein
MRDQAAHACRALCRARAAEELQRRRGTCIGEHLKLVLSTGSRSVDSPFTRASERLLEHMDVGFKFRVVQPVLNNIAYADDPSVLDIR